jgi:pyruvate/2-oxoglutarate dehydrogenase complex dihydrolipoamide dehydrogenase (E3) component
MLISTGRKAYTAGLNLEKVGIATDKFGRVEINDNF